MKRINKKRKTQKIREDALKQLRETRARIEKDHPDLLDSVRKIIEMARVGANKPAQGKPKLKSEKPDDRDDEMILIDRKKNLEAILKYAASKPDSKGLKEELKDFLN